MKGYSIYVCDVCGFMCTDADEVLKCEARHLGLTLDEYNRYNNWRSFLHFAYRRYKMKRDEYSYQVYIKAFNDIRNFERTHNILNSNPVDGTNRPLNEVIEILKNQVTSAYGIPSTIIKGE